MKRKIIINPKPLKDIENPSDFQELLKKYNSAVPVDSAGSGSVTLVKWAAGIAAVIAVGFFIFNPSNDQSLTTSEVTDSVIPEKIAKIKAPLFELPYWEVTINPQEETTVISPEGVIIEIPENAFKNKAGLNFNEDVTLKLTQYDDALNILVSQIPMSYDSAGTKMHFQSDGMFNLTALDNNNNELELKEKLTVNYPQTTGREASNTYTLVNNKWEYLESTPITTYAEVCQNTVYKFQEEETPEVLEDKALVQFKQTEQKLESEFLSLENSKPLEPKKQNLNNYRFQLDVNPSEFPELSNFKNVIFEVKDARFTWSIYEETWNDIAVKRSTREGRYLVTLKNTKRVEIFDVYPVLDDVQFSKAFAQYGEDMKRIEERKKDISTKIRENKKRETQFLADLKKHKQHENRLLEKKRIVNQLTAELEPRSPFRSVGISQLGTVNFDIGLPLPPKGIEVPANFILANDNQSLPQISLINLNQNIYYTYVQPEYDSFRYLKGKKHILVAVLADGTIAAYKTDLNSQKIKKGEPFTFKLEVSDATNLEELRYFLGLAESV